MDDVNDVSNEYMQVAQGRSERAIIEDMLSNVARRRAAKETSSAVPPSVDAAAPPSAVPEAGGVMSALAAGSKDLLKGVFKEAPGALASGAYDAAHNAATGALHAWDSLAQWLDENVANLRVGEGPSPGETLAGMLPDKIPEGAQETTTGHVIREGSRFLTGFIPAVRVLKGAGMGNTAASIGGGGLSDFVTRDPSDKNVSNLIQQFPALQNPVNEFLATNPESPEALNRLRQGIEGLGFGALTEGVVRGIRAAAASKQAKTEIELQQQQYGTVAPEQMQALGNPEAPLVLKGSAAKKLDASMKATETGVHDQVAARGVASAADEQAANAGLSRVLRADYEPGQTVARGAKEIDEAPIYVNFGRMNTPDDVQAVIKETAKAFKGEINEARRGVQTNEQTKALADQLGMTPESLLARRQGQPLSAEEGLAARRLWNTSAEKLLELSRKAAEPNAGPVDLYNFRKMLAVHQALQSEVIAARTETARALQAWSIPAGTGGTEMARGVQQLMDSMGGAEVTQELARRFATLSSSGIPAGALATAVRRGWGATTMDMVKESYVLGLLWNPSTHLVNVASNTAVAFQQVYERGLASKIGDFIGTAADTRVVDGEAIAMAYGMIESLHDALRLSSKALRTGQTQQGLSKVDLSPAPSIASSTVSRELGQSAGQAQAFAETPLGRGIDLFGTATRLPGHALTAEDEFFKTISYRAEVHAQALRQATAEGHIGADRFRRMAELANDPPEHIRLSASDAALYATFQNKPGEWAQALLDLRSSGTLNPTFMVLPFVRTPANILRYTFERTPVAPLVKQWRDDIAAGGARRDLALARMSSGTAVMATGLDLASSGLITGAGPSEPAEREVLERQGWKPFSIYVDGEYYSYNRADPFGTQLGFMATLAEKMKSKELDGEDFDSISEAMAAGIATISQSIVDKTYFRGVADVLSVIKSTERNDGRLKQYFDKQAATLVPFSSALNVAKRLDDPVQREATGPWEEIQSRLPFLSKNLPASRDLWGKEKKPQEIYGRVYDVVSPAAVSQDIESPVDAELERLRTSVARIKRSDKFEGVDVSFDEFPEVYDYYVRLAGNELKAPQYNNLGAKDFLDAVVSGKHPRSPIYQRMSDDTQAAYIKNVVSEYREMARQQILSEAPKRFPEFAQHIRTEQQEIQRGQLPRGFENTPVPLRPAPPQVQKPLPSRKGASPSSDRFAVPN